MRQTRATFLITVSLPFLALLVVFTSPVAAAGSGTLSLDELVRRSEIVFSAQLVSVRTEFVRVKEGAELKRYASAYHMRLRLELPLRGRTWLERRVDRRRELSVVLKNRVFDKRPERVYVRSYAIYRAGRGDRVILFARAPKPGPFFEMAALVVDEIDSVTRLGAVNRIVERMIEPELRRLRMREGRCKKVWTFVYAGRCATTGEITASLRCPPTAMPYARRLDGALVVGCRGRDGRGEGTELVWHRNGELLRQSSRHLGQLNGVVMTFDEQGRRLARATYVDGNLHGYYVGFYPSGKRRLEGFYRAGLRDGYWTQWSERGLRLGRFRMSDGSGIERRWYQSGRLRAEIEWRGGILDGGYRARGPGGALVVIGRHLAGKRHGAWRFFRRNGRLQRMACYRLGRELWSTDDARTARQLPCR